MGRGVRKIGKRKENNPVAGIKKEVGQDNWSTHQLEGMEQVGVKKVDEFKKENGKLIETRQHCTSVEPLVHGDKKISQEVEKLKEGKGFCTRKWQKDMVEDD